MKQISFGERGSCQEFEFRILQNVQAPHRMVELQAMTKFLPVTKSRPFFALLPVAKSSYMVTTLNGIDGLRSPERSLGITKRDRIGIQLLARLPSSGNWASSQFGHREISDVHRTAKFFHHPITAHPASRIPAGGKRDQFGHGLEIKLSFDVRTMGFDGLGAQMEFLCKFGRCFCLGRLAERLPRMAVAQALDGRSFGAFAGDVLEESSRHFVAQVNASGQHLPNCLHHRRTAFLFHDITVVPARRTRSV